MTTYPGVSSAEDRPKRPSTLDRLRRQLSGSHIVLRELSYGGPSSVFLATEIALDRQVVIKALPPETAAGVDIERFQREIALAARLQHPHLVPLLSAGTPVADPADGPTEGDPGQAIPWFSMPFVEGATLRERLLSGGPLPLAEAVRLMREMASALSYAHARGVVHRDIKPENVLLSDGVAMITDFGVAMALDDSSEDALRSGKRLTTVSMILGTPAYMAPEQVNSARLVDHKADIYALGCVAYELITGTPPLARSSHRATLAAQVSEEPVSIGLMRPGVPPQLADVIMRALNKDPLERPHSASVVVRVIDGVIAQPMTSGEYTAAVATEDAFGAAISAQASTQLAPKGSKSATTTAIRPVAVIAILAAVLAIILMTRALLT